MAVRRCPAVASGKTLLAELSKWTQTEFGVTFGPPAIARQMRQADITREFEEIIRAIEEGSSFPSLEQR